MALGGVPLRLIDTAGLRAAAESESREVDEAERIGMARTREALADADLVLLVHDATEAVTAEELRLAAALKGRPHLRVENKIDLLTAPGSTAPGVIPTSALTGEGLDALRTAILALLGAEGSIANTAALNTLRQREAVTAALTSLRAAADANTAGLPHELILVDLHAALAALDSLTGTTTAEDILGRIFSTFCIGK